MQFVSTTNTLNCYVTKIFLGFYSYAPKVKDSKIKSQKSYEYLP